MSEELKPCPFCGSTLLGMSQTGIYWGRCDSCHCEGPTAETEAKAIAAWNRRAQPAQVAALAAALAALTAEQERLGLYEQPAAPALTPCRGLQDSTCTYLATCGGICNKCGKSHDGKENASLPFAAAPSVAPEPVAWTLQSELDAAETTCSAHLWFTNPRNSAWTALFTREKIAAHPPRAPLTDEEIEALRVEHGLDECDPSGFARAIEAAHGISAEGAAK